MFQLTAKDTQGMAGMNLEQKVKVIVNSLGGRTIGFNAFGDAQQFSPTFNIGNAINKTSEIGALLWGLSEIGFLGAKWGTRGAKIALGGALGGIFDDPPFERSPQYGTQGGPYPYGAYDRTPNLPALTNAPWTQ